MKLAQIFVFSVVLIAADTRVITNNPWGKTKISSDVTTTSTVTLDTGGDADIQNVDNPAEDAWSVLKRLQVIDQKSEKVMQTLRKFQDDLTSLRQINGITGDHYKAMFADIAALKRLVKDAVLGYVKPFRPLSKLPPRGFYADDVTDVDNAEYQLKKILKAMKKLGRQVDQELTHAENEKDEVEHAVHIFQWAVRLTQEAKQTHASITSLRKLIRENLQEEKLEAEDAKTFMEQLDKADDQFLKNVQLPLHHFEPLDKPPRTAYPTDVESTLTNVQNVLLSVKQSLVQIGDNVIRSVYESGDTDDTDSFKSRKLQTVNNNSKKRTRRFPEMEGTLIELGDPAMRMLRDSEDKKNEEAERTETSWKTSVAVGGLMALCGVALGGVFAMICYLYKKELSRDPYRFRRSDQKLTAVDKSKK